MPRAPLLLCVAGLTAFWLGTMEHAFCVETLQWEKGPAIPDREGYAGPFSGVHNGVLLLAGGANFPDRRPWEGGTKIWYDRVQCLDALTGTWRDAGKLPRPLGYGVSISTPDGVICIGGSDATAHHTDVFRLQWNGRSLQVVTLPKFPKPCANACGALLGNTIYVAGGIEAPDSTEALTTFWSLNLSQIQDGWREERTWPGPARMLSVAGVHNGAFYLFGGAGLKKGADGKPERIWLQDAYRFKPGEGWTRIADLPRVSVAAPSPAPLWKNALLVIGGDDGAQIKTAPTDHKGFPRQILAYDPLKNAWDSCGDVPFSLVTTPLVEWNNRMVIPGGEARPGIRSTEVWSAPLR